MGTKVNGLVDSSAAGAPRGRRRRTHFIEHIESARSLVGYDAADEAAVTRTRAIVRSRADAISDLIYTDLLSHPETAVYLAGLSGAEQQFGMTRDAFRAWVRTVCDGELDEAAADRLAQIGHEHVRPRDDQMRPVRARLLLITLSNVQTNVVALLQAHIGDPEEVLVCALAWAKLLAVQLDLFLAIYSATERHARWY